MAVLGKMRKIRDELSEFNNRKRITEIRSSSTFINVDGTFTSLFNQI